MSEKEPLHETVLRVAFQANPDRPILLSTDDIYWKIEDPILRIPEVKEVLEWLVNRGEMEKDIGKYILSRPKFFELKNEIQAKEVTTRPKSRKSKAQTPVDQPKSKPASVASPQKAVSGTTAPKEIIREIETHTLEVVRAPMLPPWALPVGAGLMLGQLAGICGLAVGPMNGENGNFWLPMALVFALLLEGLLLWLVVRNSQTEVQT